MSASVGCVPDIACPLTGLLVVELGSSVAAPYAGEILGDLGADVIKVEKPGGDDARAWGPPFWGGAQREAETRVPRPVAEGEAT